MPRKVVHVFLRLPVQLDGEAGENDAEPASRRGSLLELGCEAVLPIGFGCDDSPKYESVGLEVDAEVARGLVRASCMLSSCSGSSTRGLALPNALWGARSKREKKSSSASELVGLELFCCCCCCCFFFCSSFFSTPRKSMMGGEGTRFGLVATSKASKKASSAGFDVLPAADEEGPVADDCDC